MEYSLSQGVFIEELNNEALTAFEKSQTAFRNGFVRYQPSGQVLPREFANYEKTIMDMEVFEDDIWISSFPKCGTTWTQEMVWNIVNDLDFVTAKSTKLDRRIPFLELTALTEKRQFEVFNEEERAENETLVASVEYCKNLSSRPRILKTHLDYDMLPKQVEEKKPKVIYVTRNPRDAVVSYYNHWRVLDGFTGSFDVFFNAFVGDVAGYYCPFIPHVLKYWRRRTDQNILFITYEEMKRDLPAVIRKTADFLNKTISPDQVFQLAEHLSFKKMKDNKAVNKEEFQELSKQMTGSSVGQFMRKGETGDWKNHLSAEQVRRISEWEKKHLEGTDLEFVYEL